MWITADLLYKTTSNFMTDKEFLVNGKWVGIEYISVYRCIDSPFILYLSDGTETEVSRDTTLDYRIV